MGESVMNNELNKDERLKEKKNEKTCGTIKVNNWKEADKSCPCYYI